MYEWEQAWLQGFELIFFLMSPPLKWNIFLIPRKVFDSEQLYPWEICDGFVII